MRAVLGEAFQMSNFIRDVAEDLRRGRVYLPQEDLDRFGVTRADLAAGSVTPSNVRELLRFEIARTRDLYAAAEPGIDLLHPTSRDCIRTAFTLYGGILDAVEAADLPGAGPAGRRAAASPAGRGRTRLAQGAARALADRERRPQNTHHDRVCTTSEKPNSRSSTGAYTSRAPRIAPVVVDARCRGR